MSVREELEINLVMGAGMPVQAARALLDAYAREAAMGLAEDGGVEGGGDGGQ